MQRPRADSFLPFLFAGAFLFILWLPTIDTPFGRNQGIWAVIADQMQQGGLPYRDGISTKPPGILYLYSWSLGLWRDMVAIRLLDLLWVGATTAFIVLLAPPSRRAFMAPLLGLLMGWTFFHAASYWQMASPDLFMGMPVMAAVWMQRARLPSAFVLRRLLIGMAFGWAFWLKYPALAITPLIALMDLKGPSALRDRSAAQLAKAWSITGLGFLAVVGAVLLHLTVRGGLEAFRETQVDYLLGYAGYRVDARGPNTDWAAFRLGGVREMLRHFPFLVLPALLLPLFRGSRSWTEDLWLWAGTSLAVMAVAVQKKLFLTHWGPVLPWLCLLTAASLSCAAQSLKGRQGRPRQVGAAGLAAFMLGCVAVTGPGAFRTYTEAVERMAGGPADRREYLADFENPNFSFLTDLEVACYLERRTRPSDRVFIWGFEPLIYFLADRQPASRFLAVTTLVSPAAKPSWREELTLGLVASPPEIFIVAKNDDFGFLHGVPGDSEQLIRRRFPELQRWLEQRYVRETQIGDLVLWRRRSAGAGAMPADRDRSSAASPECVYFEPRGQGVRERT